MIIFCVLWLNLLADMFRFVILTLRSRNSLAAENLFLRKQLAFYRERKIKPPRISHPKRRVKAKQGFREFHAARRTIAGYEAIHMIRKGQARGVSDDDVRQQNWFIDRLFDLAA